jgi:hypothetical protein
MFKVSAFFCLPLKRISPNLPTINQFVVVLALAAVASAQIGGGFGGFEGGIAGGEHKDIHAYPKYKYEYGVKDLHTHDHKSQKEERDGEHTNGVYTLDEADGTHRIVHYHDNGHGLEAHVERVGHAKHPYHGISYANQHLVHHH